MTTEKADPLQQARAEHRAGRLDAAARHYRRAAQRSAHRVDALLGLGVLDLQRGAPARAVASLEKAARLAPDHPEVLVNLGQALMGAGRTDPAIGRFRAAADLLPEVGAVWFQLAYALQSAGRLFEAAAAYEQVVRCEPQNSDAHNNLAGVLQNLGRVTQAAAHFQAAARLRPDDVSIRVNLAMALELAGELTAAQAAADDAAAMAPGQAMPVLLQGRLAGRRGDLPQAEDLLRQVASLSPPPAVAASALKERALVLDRMGDYAAAMTAADEGNAIRQRDASSRGYDAQRWRGRLQAYRSVFTTETLTRQAMSAAGDDYPAPVFFVGFPRSGTTLMETIFAADDGLITTGELSPLNAVLDELAASREDRDVAAAIAALPPRQMAPLRARFWRAAENLFGDEVASRRLVDKAPFNLAELGLINLLFPDARIVVALRDPRDVCISCYMQDFALSDAVACMLDLDGTASLYADTMTLWRHYQSALTVPWMTYRYEDLVADPAGVAARIFDFIDVPWNPALLAARDAGAGRAFVGTPSRAAVSQPISGRAVGRWRRYEQRLAPILPVLAPFATEYGYEAD